MKLENAEGIVYAHPFVKSFDHVYYCLTNEESKLVSSGDVPPQVAKRTKEDVKDLDDTITVYTACFYVGLKLQDNMRGARSDSCPRKFLIPHYYSDWLWREKSRHIISDKRIRQDGPDVASS